MGINIYQKGRIPSCMLSDKKVEIKIDLDNSENDVPNLILDCLGAPNIFDLDRHNIDTSERPDGKLGFSIRTNSWHEHDGVICPKCSASKRKLSALELSSHDYKCGICNFVGKFPTFYSSIDRYSILPKNIIKQLLAMRVAREALKEKEAELLVSENARHQKLTAKYLQEKVKRRGIYVPKKYFK